MNEHKSQAKGQRTADLAQGNTHSGDHHQQFQNGMSATKKTQHYRESKFDPDW